MLRLARTQDHVLLRVPLLAGVIVVTAALSACAQSRVVREPEKPRVATTRPATSRVVKPVAPLPVPAGDFYTVQAGDTVYGIAFRAGLNFRDLAAWNNIGEAYTIQVGQRLRLHPPMATPQPTKTAAAVRNVPPPVAAAKPPVVPAPVNREPIPAAQITAPVTTAVAMSQSVVAKPVPNSAATIIPKPEVSASTMAPLPPALSASSDTSSSPPEKPVAAIVTTAENAGDTGNGAMLHWRWPSQGPLIGRFVAGDQTQQGINIAGSAGQPVVASADGVVVYSGAGLVGYGELIIIKHSNEWLSAYAHNRRRLVAEGAVVNSGQVIAEMGRTGAIRDMLHFEIRRNGRPVDPLQWLPSR